MPWIGAPQHSHAQNLLGDMFARQGMLPNIAPESDDVNAPLSLVRAGLGLALLREDVAVKAAERGELVVWPHTRGAALLCLIYPKVVEHDPVIVASLQVLRSVLGADTALATHTTTCQKSLAFDLSQSLKWQK